MFHRYRLLSIVLWSGMLLATGWWMAWNSIQRSGVPASVVKSDSGLRDGHDHSDHDHHQHGHEEGGDKPPPLDISISDQARENLQLKTGPVATSDFWRTITVPAEVQEKEGHSESRITSAVNGLITKVHVLPGQVVSAGDSLFDVQTTGDLLANAQSSLLKTVQDLDLVEVELKRLKPIADQGAVPGVRLLEKQYEKQRLDIQRQVQIQELLVRGLSLPQIEEIIHSKVLLRHFTVVVPGGSVQPNLSTNKSGGSPHIVLPASFQKPEGENAKPPNLQYSVEKINVFPGKFVQTGDELCDLALHTTLRIAGMAFQSESELISRVFEERRPVRVLFDSARTESVSREGLQIEFVDNVIDPKTGLFRFFLPLENEALRDVVGKDGIHFRVWRFKPGQRARLLIPAEEWKDQIVLPSEAVVREGPDAFVFRSNGKLFERTPVSVKYEDPRQVVVANDGSLFPGDEIAMNSAYQLNLALKKLQGAGTDPHAGHNH